MNDIDFDDIKKGDRFQIWYAGTLLKVKVKKLENTSAVLRVVEWGYYYGARIRLAYWEIEKRRNDPHSRIQSSSIEGRISSRTP